MRHRALTAISASAVLALSTLAIASTSSAQPSDAPSSDTSYSGSFALSGDKAAEFVLPEHMKKVHTQTFPDGRTSTRYQQKVRNATVLGGQVTVIRDAEGTNQAVIGAYFPDLLPQNAPKLSGPEAKG
ncbi:MAG TPA: hypothetical protein VFJ14_13985, partial [Nocardioidaceae bacterium]|nr:hypothetical protein [Nocardioidaceae bacterium]